MEGTFAVTTMHAACFVISTAGENTACGDAAGWTALPVWETGERLGRARVKSLTISPCNVITPCVFMSAKQSFRFYAGLCKRSANSADFYWGVGSLSATVIDRRYMTPILVVFVAFCSPIRSTKRCFHSFGFAQGRFSVDMRKLMHQDHQ